MSHSMSRGLTPAATLLLAATVTALTRLRRARRHGRRRLMR